MIDEYSSEIECTTKVVFSPEEWSKIKEVQKIMEKHNLVIELRASGGYYQHQEEGCFGHTIKELPRRPGDTGKFCLKCKYSNHNTGECFRKQCRHCKEWTHLAKNCRKKKKGKK
ncbi:3693_t:CDS:2, partial [Funneliformis geosporum]